MVGAGSYNAVNGLPTCANPAMNQTLRGDWGFEGCTSAACHRTTAPCFPSPPGASLTDGLVCQI
jgi:hypothetical protein